MANYKVIYRNDNPEWQKGCPIEIVTTQVSRNVDTAQCFLQTKVKNISSILVSSLTLKGSVTSPDGTTENIELNCLDADVAPGGTYILNPYELKLNDVTSVKLLVSKINRTDEFKELEPKPEGKKLTLSLKAQEEQIAQAKECGTLASLEFVHEEHDDWWLCSCGAVNVSREKCHACNTPLSMLNDWENEQLLENAADERAYKKACNLMDQSSEPSLKGAIATFESLGSYKDSQDLAEQCRKKIAALSLKKKKRKRITFISAACLIVLVAAILVTVNVVIPTVEQGIEQSNNYNNAIAQINEGNIVAAYESFVATDGYSDSAEKAESIYDEYFSEKLKTLSEDDSIYFGSYEQDNDTSNGKEKIEWLVLGTKDGKALLISKYALDCQPYNVENKTVTWETCTLRTWLNDTFINDAFSSTEQNYIQETKVSADKNPQYSTDPGNDTTDKIFLLSAVGANQLFSSNASRKCIPTDYAIAQGVDTAPFQKIDNKATCRWWLRSPGDGQDTATTIQSDGGIYYYGRYVWRDGYAVRPALWINLEF